MRPSRWSPEISRPRSGSCRTTCEGAWPGVSWTSKTPRSVSTGVPARSSRSGGTRSPSGLGPSRRDSRIGLERLIGHTTLAEELAAAGERRLGIGRGRGHVAVVGVHPQLAPGGLAHRGRLPVVVRVRVGADQQADVLEPRAGLLEARSSCSSAPGAAIPQSTSTTPDPDAIAHPFTCGTADHGSGSRRRHRPGSTRSARASSRRRGAAARVRLLRPLGVARSSHYLRRVGRRARRRRQEGGSAAAAPTHRVRRQPTATSCVLRERVSAGTATCATGRSSQRPARRRRTVGSAGASSCSSASRSRGRSPDCPSRGSPTSSAATGWRTPRPDAGCVRPCTSTCCATSPSSSPERVGP